mgnify:CR=1 FL=1
MCKEKITIEEKVEYTEFEGYKVTRKGKTTLRYFRRNPQQIEARDREARPLSPQFLFSVFPQSVLTADCRRMRRHLPQMGVCPSEPIGRGGQESITPNSLELSWLEPLNPGILQKRSGKLYSSLNAPRASPSSTVNPPDEATRAPVCPYSSRWA